MTSLRILNSLSEGRADAAEIGIRRGGVTVVTLTSGMPIAGHQRVLRLKWGYEARSL